MISSALLEEYVTLARQNNYSPTLPPNSPNDMDLSNLRPFNEYRSSITSDSPPYVISTVEATSYYAGISRSPPKLVYRTSKDPFIRPKGPEAYRRLKVLCPVYNHRLGDKWGSIGPKIRDLLDKQQVVFSTIDVVRFRTLPDQQTTAAISPVVIWIGVIPDSLAGEDAFNAANSILAILEDEDIAGIDVEFRESVFRRSAGAELYGPADNLDPTKHVIDPLTTALGLPIAAQKTPNIQGTMGFYFKDGNALYGVTARHVLFPADEYDSSYTYNSHGPRKEVLLMGTNAWENYLKSIQTQIKSLDIMAEIHRESIGRLERMAEVDVHAGEKAEKKIEKTRELLEEASDAINELQQLFRQTEEDFGKPSQRVIGHIVWSPAITTNNAPHGFTTDICVIKLDEARFRPNFRGNVIDLGKH